MQRTTNMSEGGQDIFAMNRLLQIIFLLSPKPHNAKNTHEQLNAAKTWKKNSTVLTRLCLDADVFS